MLPSSIFTLLPVILTLFSFCCNVKAGKEDLRCDICRAVVREANWNINQADPKKFVQVGSFRVDPSGNQNIKEKKYARSEGHVEDVIESVCDRLRDYAKLTNDDGSKDIVRYVGVDGTKLQTNDLDLDRSFGKQFQYRCDDFLENHEETIISLLQQEDGGNYEEIICGEETGACSEEQLSRPVTELQEAEVEAVLTSEAAEDDDEEGDDEDSGGKQEVPLDTTQKDEL